MSTKNTIVVITGPTGHQYVASVGKTAALTPVLDSAKVMTVQQAVDIARQLDLPAVPRDVDEWRVRVGRAADVHVKLEAEVQSVLE